MTPEKQWLAQKERMLAWLRLGFSLAAIFIIHLNPDRAANFPTLSNVSLFSFFLYSLAIVYFTQRHSSNPREIGVATTCLDLGWISLLVFSTGGSQTPFFVYYFFPVITASSRYGIKGGLAAALIGVTLYGLIRFSRIWENPLGIDVYITRSIYLVALAYIFGFLSEFERKQNARLLTLYNTAGEVAKQEERRRIARELHDRLLQTLASLSLRIEACRKHLLESPKDLAQELLIMEDTTRSSITEIRQFLQGKDSRGLVPGTLLERLREDIGFLRDGLGLAVVLESDPEEPSLNPTVEEQAYYVLREGLLNIARHSQASRAEIYLRQTSSEIQAAITDDGVGFDLATAWNGNGFGLTGMKERIEKLGGSLSIKTAPARGTTISVRLPLNGQIASV